MLRLLLLCLMALVPVAARAASQPVDTVPRIALFSAFEPEWKALLAIVEQPVSHTQMGVEFVTGRVEGHDVVLVLSGVSMVNAAMTAQMAIDRFNLRAILFSGIAGGVDPSLISATWWWPIAGASISRRSWRARRRRAFNCRRGRSRSFPISA